MRKISNIVSVSVSLIIFLLVFSPYTGLANNNDSDNSKDVFRTIWKYEMDQTKYSPDDGIAKKIFYLSINSDGSYHQYVQVIPINPRDYFKVKNYTIDGKWSERDGKLVLDEYGKENAIDYSYMYTNFENIDNQYITGKK